MYARHYDILNVFTCFNCFQASFNLDFQAEIASHILGIFLHMKQRQAILLLEYFKTGTENVNKREDEGS